MAFLHEQLELQRCPHCSVDKPNLISKANLATADHVGENGRVWRVYVCARCGGAVLAGSHADGEWVEHIYPEPKELDRRIDREARLLLQQALDAVHTPDGAVMLSGRAVEAMLRISGYSHETIEESLAHAAADGLISDELLKWGWALPLQPIIGTAQGFGRTISEARDCIEFALILGELLFVLPKRVRQGIQGSTRPPKSQRQKPAASKQGDHDA